MKAMDQPSIKPERPWFSAGPTAKRPGYAPGGLPTNLLGRGIRAPEVVERFAHGLRLTREVQNSLVRVTIGGAPCTLWPGGGITMSGRLATQVAANPRVHLLGYGPSASTIGANRAGREAARVAAELLGAPSRSRGGTK